MRLKIAPYFCLFLFITVRTMNSEETSEATTTTTLEASTTTVAYSTTASHTTSSATTTVYQSTTQSRPADTTTTLPPTTTLALGCGHNLCSGRFYIAPNGVRYCLSNSLNLQYCDTGNATFFPVTSVSKLDYIACFGNLNFTLVDRRYRLREQTLCVSEGSNCTSTNFSVDDLRWYFARLKSSEGQNLSAKPTM